MRSLGRCSTIFLLILVIISTTTRVTGTGSSGGDVGTSINNRLKLGRVYFFHHSDVVESADGAVNFFEQTRYTASPDPLQVDRHTVRVVLLLDSSGAPASGVSPDIDHPATEMDAMPGELFYPTASLLDAATLEQRGGLGTASSSTRVFLGSLTMPEQTGVFSLQWSSGSRAWKATIESTCDDGLFCNGPEYFIRGGCASTGEDPCSFGDSDCLKHSCDEKTRLCSPDPIGS